MSQSRTPLLPTLVRFGLFTTSFMPLFLLIGLRQVTDNFEYLKWGGLNYDALFVFFHRFGVSSALLILSAIGGFILIVTIRNLEAQRDKGYPVGVSDVRNRNAESISYIGTYIIPFLFEDFGSLFSVLSLAVLLTVIYFIYINSSLLLINPVLNLKYSIYEVEYFDSASEALRPRSRNGMILTAERMLEEGDRLLFQRLGHKLFFAYHAPVRATVSSGSESADPDDPSRSDSSLSDYS